MNNHKIIKHITCLICISVFILGAIASEIGPDASSNTTVAIKDCEVKPEVEGYVTINVSFTNTQGEPIPDVGGYIFIAHQQVNDNTECKFESFFQSLDLYTGPDGKFSYTSPFEYNHDNSQDLYRVEVLIPKSTFYTGCKEVQVQKYAVGTFNFHCVAKRLNEL